MPAEQGGSMRAVLSYWEGMMLATTLKQAKGADPASHHLLCFL